MTSSSSGGGGGGGASSSSGGGGGGGPPPPSSSGGGAPSGGGGGIPSRPVGVGVKHCGPNVGLNVSNELYKIAYFMIKSNMEVCVCVQKKKYVS